MTSDQRFMLRVLVLLGVAAAVLAQASAGTAVAQDRPAPAKQDPKARQATKAKQDAAGATRTKRISQRPKIAPKKKTARGIQPRGASAAANATVVLKPGEVPNIEFDTPSYDFGRVRAGQPIKHDFWFTNTGTGPLEILRVKPS